MPLKRRTAGMIDRFVPYEFSTAKRQKLRRKKVVLEFPENLILAVSKNVYNDPDYGEIENELNIKLKNMKTRFAK